jgi:hypothetical protein
MRETRGRGFFVVWALLGTSSAFAQTFQDDVGWAALQALLGSGTPTGTGVTVTQIEASLVAYGQSGYPLYAPDLTNPAFAGKSFYFPGTASTAASSHATGVGVIYYGSASMAYGVTQIVSYEADAWLQDNAVDTVSPPYLGARIANDSWVGASDTPADSSVLLRVADRLVADEALMQVVAMPYSSGNPLLAGGFNVIAVGETAATNFLGSDALDSLYVAGRARPDLVAPLSTTSDATPLVAAAAAMLVETGHNAGSTLSSGSSFVTGVGTVYDAELPVTIRAALMAGADRATQNQSTSANVSGYGTQGYLTRNGLDTRYGAGQLDVLKSYEVIAGGEHHSRETGGSGTIGTQGFDVAATFGGGAGSNNTATYLFVAGTNATFTASLVWNVAITNDGTLQASLHRLTLTLLDTTTQQVESAASSIDNSQHLWVNLTSGHHYELLVNVGESDDFTVGYALAWYTSSGQNVPSTATVTSTATTVAAGGNATLTATPPGGGTYTYQWYQGASGDTANPISGATGATYKTPALTVATSYWVLVTASNGTTYASAPVTITVAVAIAETTQTDAPLPGWALGALGILLLGATARSRSRI